jgi:hypothetical protein
MHFHYQKKVTELSLHILLKNHYLLLFEKYLYVSMFVRVYMCVCVDLGFRVVDCLRACDNSQSIIPWNLTKLPFRQVGFAIRTQYYS